MNKQTTPRMSMLLIAMLAQFSVSHLAQAESANDWGNWADNSDTPSNVAFNYTPSTNNNNNNNQNTNNPNAQPTPDQTRTATNGGNLTTETTAAGGWVGYALYSEVTATRPCNNCCTTSYVVNENKLATLTLNPQPANGVVSGNQLQESTGAGKLSIASEVAAFNMSFDSAKNTESNNTYSYFQFNTKESSQPSSFNGSFTSPSSQYGVNAGESSEYYGSININRYESSDLNVKSHSGSGFFGKVMPAADIAYLSGLSNQSYQFFGSSRLGSMVQLSVNFNAKSWSGSWSSTNTNNTIFHTGFNAAGTINGSSLTSTSVITSGQPSLQNAGTVRSGSVQGTLVGIANANASNVGVVGSTTLTVMPLSNGASVVNDVFNASAMPQRVVVDLNDN